jgi:hypothetical protein
VRGEPPSHPDLLDWLAVEFAESGWDVKRLDRLLVTSATYRQSSQATSAQLETDPGNRLWLRASRVRLDAEVLRDSALSAAGLLGRRVGGPSVKPYQPADLWKHITYDRKNTQVYDQGTGEGLLRRSLYTYWKRQVPPPTMQLLDAPTRETCVLRSRCAKRSRKTGRSWSESGMKTSCYVLGLVTGLTAVAAINSPAAENSPVTLAENGQARAIIVVPSGRQSRAATELRDYLEKATGTQLRVMDERQLGAVKEPFSRVFVGDCQATRRVIDFKSLRPEGFVIKSEGNDIYISGGDFTDGGPDVDGTYYGVCEFLERYVGVRWLMPGPLGEIVPKTRTLRIDVTEIRQEPVLWQRKMREVRTTGHRSQMLEQLEKWNVPIEAWEAKFGKDVTGPWCARQRLGARVNLQFGHSYDGWWDKYHDKHPEIFALQPNGTRINTPTRERLCKSNPVLWELVAKDRIEELRANPKLVGISIAPNDGGGGNRFCCCERCRSWDSPETQAIYRKDPEANQGPGGEGPFPPLSDRFFRYFNEVAKRVKTEMPDRYLGTYAYSLYKSPPVSIEKLEDNLVIGYVGPNNMVSDRDRETARREITEWSKKAKQLMVRPNLLGNPVGLPVIYVHKLGEDIRFAVDSGVRMTDFASAFGNWGTQGLNYYVLVKLLWNPYQEVDPLIDDYCRAAYGQGAQAIKEYYRRAEEVTNRIAVASVASPTDNTTTDFYSDAVLTQLQEPLSAAIEIIGKGDPAALERVRMLERGLEYTRATRRLMRAAADVRQKKATRQQFVQVEAEVIPIYKSLVMDWAVASEQNYRKIRMGLSLNPNRRSAAEDADDM